MEDNQSDNGLEAETGALLCDQLNWDSKEVQQ
jgi:hypothetical protein